LLNGWIAENSIAHPVHPSYQDTIDLAEITLQEIHPFLKGQSYRPKGSRRAQSSHSGPAPSGALHAASMGLHGVAELGKHGTRGWTPHLTSDEPFLTADEFAWHTGTHLYGPSEPENLIP